MPGIVYCLTNPAGEGEEIEFDLFGPAYYALAVDQFDDASAPFYLVTNLPVHPAVDPEPHILANVIPASGTLVRGAFDFSGDEDVYDIDLVKGQTLKVIARSILGDPFIELWNGTDTVAEDDDSGGGLWGTDAELVVVAPATGTYTMIVFNTLNMGGAEYELTLTLK